MKGGARHFGWVAATFALLVGAAFGPAAGQTPPATTTPAGRDQFGDQMMRLRLDRKPPRIAMQRLKQEVEEAESRQAFPLTLKVWDFRLADGAAVLVVSLEVCNANLFYRRDGEGFQAELAIYGCVRTLDERLLTEFEDGIVSRYAPTEYPNHAKDRSLYQRLLFVPPGSGKVSVVASQAETKDIAMVEQGFRTSRDRGEDFSLSAPILAATLEAADPFARGEDPFVLGNVRLRPNVSGVFPKDGQLACYFQILPGTTPAPPHYAVRYEICRGPAPLLTVADPPEKALCQAAPERCVAARTLSLASLAAGVYTLRITVTEAASGKERRLETSFRVENP